MNLKRRLISAAVIALLLTGMIGVSMNADTASADSSESLFQRRTTLNLWYNDDALTDFLNDACVSYNSTQRDYRVVPVLVTDTGYIDSVNKASVADDNMPDIYIAGNNELERLYKGGLAAIIDDPDHMSDTSVFPQTALDAVTYDGKYVAYPLSFETSALLYNREYLGEMAANENRTIADTVPRTMTDIIRLSNNYDAPEEVTAVMKWDVADIFYNYCFVGAYLDMGGSAGDDSESIDIYNEQLIQCLQVYQQLNQYFAIDSHTDDYNSVLESFEEGHIVFTLATTGAAKDIATSISSGNSSLDYGVAVIPDSTSDLQTKTMSVTDCFVVNAYGAEQEEANRFIRYVLYSHMDDFYDRTGRAVPQEGYAYSDAHMSGFYEAYKDSVPITKLREASNFWMLLENTFQSVWDGTDCNDALHDLAQRTMIQMSGTENYVVEMIADPKPVSITEAIENESDVNDEDAAVSTELMEGSADDAAGIEIGAGALTSGSSGQEPAADSSSSSSESAVESNAEEAADSASESTTEEPEESGE